MGDSLTFGQHLDFDVLAWPARMGAEGRGVCGETTRQALERFPRDVQDDPADVTVLQWGHNDANRWVSDAGLPRVSLQAFHANLVEMVNRCRAFGTTPVLCSLTPTRTTREYDSHVYYYNAELRRVAHTHEVTLANVREAFLENDNIDELLLDDGLHLSVAGHDLYAATVVATVIEKVPA